MIVYSARLDNEKTYWTLNFFNEGTNEKLLSLRKINTICILQEILLRLLGASAIVSEVHEWKAYQQDLFFPPPLYVSINVMLA